MKNKSKRLRRRVLVGGILALTILIIFACGVKILDLKYDKSTVDAGEVMEFTMKLEVSANEKHGPDKLIIGIRAPKSWDASKNTQITWEVTSEDPEKWRTMSLIPVTDSPKNRPGLTWNQALVNKFGGQDPNVLDDMEWVVFQADEGLEIDNATWLVTAKIKTKTGPENLRAKLGFFANHADDGLSDDKDRWSLWYTDCIEIANGEGAITDFCEFHFNLNALGKAKQNDIVTLKYIGDIDDNALMDEQNIYLRATAVTTDGKKYEVNEQTDKSKMLKESKFGKMFGITFWPEGYFEVSENEVIDRIEYYFTNIDGTKYVSLYDDENKGNTNPERPIEPFIYKFDNK